MSPHTTIPPAPSWADAIERYLVWQTALGHSKGTIRLCRYWLTRLSNAVDSGPWSVTGQHLVEFMASHPFAPQTLTTIRFEARHFYRWGVEQGHTDVDPSSYLRPVRLPPADPNPRYTPR